jgi:hypothetical protein
MQVSACVRMMMLVIRRNTAISTDYSFRDDDACNQEEQMCAFQNHIEELQVQQHKLTLVMHMCTCVCTNSTNIFPRSTGCLCVRHSVYARICMHHMHAFKVLRQPR